MIIVSLKVYIIKDEINESEKLWKHAIWYAEPRNVLIKKDV